MPADINLDISTTLPVTSFGKSLPFTSVKSTSTYLLLARYAESDAAGVGDGGGWSGAGRVHGGDRSREQLPRHQAGG